LTYLAEQRRPVAACFKRSGYPSKVPAGEFLIMKKVAGLLALFVTLPIWFFLLYRILSAINATELTWFLYWIYVPASVLVNSLTKLAEEG
jgi:hypothetical protein